MVTLLAAPRLATRSDYAEFGVPEGRLQSNRRRILSPHLAEHLAGRCLGVGPFLAKELEEIARPDRW